MMKPTLLAAALAVAIPGATLAEPKIEILDPYARSSGMSAISGAAFMVIRNSGTTDDRLVGVSSPVAERVELHTHLSDAQGVMRMVEVEDGFAVPAGSDHALARGGDHVMFLGINTPFADGATIPLTLTFEQSGDLMIEVPVNMSRMPEGHGAGGGRPGEGMRMTN
jgi:copper(I)-binding protein